MKALWLEDQTITFREDVPCPEVTGDEALIKVKVAGICATDLEQVRGYHPFLGIPGHEFVGVVESASGEPDLIGQRVVGEINIGCGSCDRCRVGLERHCDNRKVIGIRDRNGCFGEYITLPTRNLHRVPDHIPDEEAVFTEPIAAALAILQQCHIQASDKVLIIGAGRLGQLIARVLALIPCELFVIARHQPQKDILEPYNLTLLGENEVGKRWVDVVIEATGSHEGFEFALQAVRPRGTIVLKSTYATSGSINLSAVVVDEITIVGSRCGPFPPVIRLLEQGKLDLIGLISGRYPLKDGVRAYHRAAEPGVFKILFHM